jgi:hypothetical protein
MGASSSPHMIIVTKVQPDRFWYINPPSTREFVISTEIGKDLIMQGSETHLKSYARYMDPKIRKSLEALLKGGKGIAVDPADYESIEVFVAKGRGYEDEDLWRDAEQYGSVAGYESPTGGENYRIVMDRGTLKRLKKDTRFKVLKVAARNLESVFSDETRGRLVEIAGESTNEAKMGKPIAWGTPPRVDVKKGLSFEAIKKGDKVSYIDAGTGKRRVLRVTNKQDLGSTSIVYLVGKRGSSYSLYFHGEGYQIKLVRYGKDIRRVMPTDVWLRPGSLRIEGVEFEEGTLSGSGRFRRLLSTAR